jgi:hypothetical protein
MQPTQSHPGHYWMTDDAANLWFNEAGPEQPQTIRCYNMQDHLNRGEIREVSVDQLQFLAAGLFGEARPTGFSSTTRWTGDSHRYGIYRNPSGLYRNGIVVLECHGGGMCGYAFDNLVAGETWQYLAVHLPPEMIWNLCNQIAHSYRAARDSERHLWHRAFVEGRLKKRRRNNKVHIEMVPSPSPRAIA